jgi:hypothetical protein
VIIIGSKALGRFWLQKDEDYYEKHDEMWSEEK